MVRRGHGKLSVVRQCHLLQISRSGIYYTPRGESAENLALMRAIDRAFTEWPFMGVRQMRNYLCLNGYSAGRKRVRRLMRLMHLLPIYQHPKTTGSHPAHRKYPYLLREMKICTPNQVWCTDITYIWTIEDGFVYLCSIMDLYSRKIIAWDISDSLNTDSVIRCIELAKQRRNAARPLIIQSDRGVQYTSDIYRQSAKDFVLSYSHKGYPYDNAVIEAFHSLIKREWLTRFVIDNIERARQLVFEYIETFYNTVRIHSHCGYLSPNEFEKLYNLAKTMNPPI